MKILLIIIFSSVALLHSEDTSQNKSKSIPEYNDTGYPIIEAQAGFGLLWLLQGNVTISPIRYIYIQPRVSSILFANEFGVTMGIQKKFETNSIIRLGMGFSTGKAYSLSPGGGEDKVWKLPYYRMELLLRKAEDFVNGANISVIEDEGRLIFSFNFTLGYCLYR